MVTLTNAVKRELGQHFVFGFHGSELNDDIRTLIRDYHVGAVILMKRNVRDAAQVRRIITELQAVAQASRHRKPLLIGIDRENGLVSAFSSSSAGTQFPGAMALAATGSIELAQEVSVACAKELKMVGINWVYSPVADVNSDSRNPVIGVRSFGDDPYQVARYASAVSRGLTSGGVAPSAKHFPGHGDTHIDSHLALPRILKSKEELMKMELIPFEALANDVGVASVMIGHMALPLLTGDDTPASLSRLVAHGLLRGEMRYGGVAVTDCLEMDAVAEPLQGGCGVEEGAVRALVAGVDVVMACHTFKKQIGAVKAVYHALESGRLDYKELKDGARRIAKMKDLFVGEWKDVLTVDEDCVFMERWEEVKRVNLQLSADAYRRSCAVISGSAILPLQTGRDKQVLLFTPEMELLNKAVDDADGILRDRVGRVRNTAGASYLALAKEVDKKVECEHVIYSARDTAVKKGAGVGTSGVIFVMRNADRSTWQKDYLKRLLVDFAGVPVVLLASCGPYDLDGEDVAGREDTAYIASFEFTREAFEAFVGVVFDGIRRDRGRLPVSTK